MLHEPLAPAPAAAVVVVVAPLVEGMYCQRDFLGEQDYSPDQIAWSEAPESWLCYCD